MSTSFSEMGLAEPLLQALSQLNISTPTPVQGTMVPKALTGGDFMVSSQTGSGKTFAFLLPVLHRMMSSELSPMDALNGPDTLVLCPTRELAQQVSQDAINLVRCHRGLRVATVMGGMPYGKQMAGLRGARLVVGTPGRLLDLADQRKLDLSRVSTLIVDEADRMLDLGFSDDLIALSELCGNRGQTLMFSATFAPRVMGLANSLLNAPERIELTPSNETNSDISQTLHWADSFSHKRKLLTHWLNDAAVEQAVVFTSTQQDAEELARDLGDEGMQASALHGAMPQVVRNRRLQAVRRGDIKILVATDVAARGLDVPAISHVFNFGMPMRAEDYVHRIGRTGRAGRSGVAVTLAQADDRSKVREIERYIKAQIPTSVIEGLEPKLANPAEGGRGRGGKGGGSGRPQRGERRSFDDRRSFGGDRPQQEGRRSFGGDRPQNEERRSFGGDRPQQEERRPFGGDRPEGRRFQRTDDAGRKSFSRPEFGEGNRPRRSGEGFEGRPAREGGFEGRRFGRGDQESRPFARQGDAKPARSFQRAEQGQDSRPFKRFEGNEGRSFSKPEQGNGEARKFQPGDRPRVKAGFQPSSDRPAFGRGDNKRGGFVRKRAA